MAFLAGASSAPGLFLPKFEPVHWKIIRVPNPQWVTAEYEFYYLDYAGKWDFSMLSNGTDLR